MKDNAETAYWIGWAQAKCTQDSLAVAWEHTTCSRDQYDAFAKGFAYGRKHRL